MRLYHNPRCSKSRQAVALLSESGVDFEEYRYLELGIAEEDLEVLSTLSGIIRTNEQEFKSAKFDINDIELVKKALKNTPKLLQRPVLIKSQKAVIGRPPEDILGLV
ncbi:MAG: ArsC/Spx/MgsR family protein [Candidatus Poseidoniaceae archaeon]|jgi:arsenate reductase|nr:ArsC/Spx/MgsR family protein [Candidatus Poseidoniaceae archaeon]